MVRSVMEGSVKLLRIIYVSPEKYYEVNGAENDIDTSRNGPTKP
jgi:hypothetical protein